MVAGLAAPALTGSLNVQEAVARLLAGTGLEAAPDANGALIIRAAGSSKGAAADLNEIVITAQHRNELLQDVPIAVTGISARELENQRISSLQDVSRVTPGLLVSSFSYSSPTIAIRGASNTFTQIGVNKPVSVVVDDVFVTRPSAASFELFDLDSVQVLRGPQGTLFGRNVTGGAIVLITAKPSFNSTDYGGELTYGNYNEVRVDGVVSGPVADDAAAKLAVSHESHDGFGRDRLTGRAEDDLSTAPPCAASSACAARTSNPCSAPITRSIPMAGAPCRRWGAAMTAIAAPPSWGWIRNSSAIWAGSPTIPASISAMPARWPPSPPIACRNRTRSIPRPAPPISSWPAAASRSPTMPTT
jgi:outer membrane receptor protein involved in Fe transport